MGIFERYLSVWVTTVRLSINQLQAPLIMV